MYTKLYGTFDVLIKRFKKKNNTHGLSGAFLMLFSIIIEVILTPLYKKLRGKKQFVFRNHSYYYFCHWYNTTFSNERSVEISIALNILNESTDKRILEVGNVLSHYVDIDHDVVDKYEKGQSIFNEDIIDFLPSQQYDLIISISTLEHIGFDELPRDPFKIVEVIKHLRSLLSRQGQLFATIPIGYNPFLNTLIATENLFDRSFFMERISKSNLWNETTKLEALKRKFDYPYPFANSIMIGFSDDSSKFFT
tara:strand:- start:1664 stop:2416 length:753 start_codon:yes stop_codon:yes gene_type:complete